MIRSSSIYLFRKANREQNVSYIYIDSNMHSPIECTGEISRRDGRTCVEEKEEEDVVVVCVCVCRRGIKQDEIL
jgi:hypothetical protein